jgi:hypothetical protein
VYGNVGLAAGLECVGSRDATAAFSYHTLWYVPQVLELSLRLITRYERGV